MPYKSIGVEQGSQDWLDLRQLYCCASEAPMMMGESPYMGRHDLLLRKLEESVGNPPCEVSRAKSFIFKKGHDAEAKARKMLEDQTGANFAPAVVIKNNLLASLDGFSTNCQRIFEHKLLNQKLKSAVLDNKIPSCYTWQLEQMLYITNASDVLFVVSDGDITNPDAALLTYKSDPYRRQQLLEGWAAFEEELKQLKKTDWQTSLEKQALDFFLLEKEYQLLQQDKVELDSRLNYLKEAMVNKTNGHKYSGQIYTVYPTSRKSVSYKDIAHQYLPSSVIANHPKKGGPVTWCLKLKAQKNKFQVVS